MAERRPSAWRNAITRYADADPRQLVGNPENWGTHPPAQMQALTGSISELGWIAPVIVNEITQHVVDGHARIGEAIARGEASIPVAYVNLTEDQERLALATFDPITALAGTDQAMLDNLLASVTSDQAGLTELLASLATEQPKILHEDDADLTPPAEPVTKPGDLWLLGEHRLLCGDSTKAEDVARLMNGEQADMVLADPPYGMNLDTSYANSTDNLRKGARRSRGYPSVLGDDQEFDPSLVFAQVADVAEQFWWGADYYRARLPAGGSWLAWDKRVGIEDVEYSSSEFELCWSRQPHHRRLIRARWFGICGTETQDVRTRIHPTQKPLEVMQPLITEYSDGGATVFDPFLGSGSTLIAAAGLGRLCYGIEIDPAYCDVVVRRWETLTGEKAVLDG